MRKPDWVRGRKSVDLGVLVLSLVVLGAGAASAADRPRLEYNRDIRPILAENCFSCHGPDSAARKADLRLDRREAAIEAGAIVPGDTNASELIARIDAEDRDQLMPPPKSAKTLKADQKDILRRWIAAGAEYQPHWSLIAPTKPALPKVQDESWVRNPIDRFVLARLQENGLTPAPEADRRTLARRLSLDLTGLPPSPDLVESFVKDTAPQAYDRLVTRLLDTPQWGEHRARYWLDAARYADTNGYHFDNFREAWAYRDWVINAFNRNLPYDRFTIEQLAGDLLPGSTLDQQVASGFNRCNATTNEGGVIPEEYTVLYTRDRTETTSQVWMGLTANCAVCHDHKFDPLAQREFYELAAFFNNTTQQTMDGNAKDTPPTVFVPTSADRHRWESLGTELAAVRGRIEEHKQSARPEFTRWLDKADPDALVATVPGNGLRLAANPGAGIWPEGRFEAADSGDFEKDQPFSFGAWVKLPREGMTGSAIARMDNNHGYRGWDLWLEGNRVATHIVHNWPDDALKVVARGTVPAGVWTHLLVTYDGSSRASGVKIFINGEPQATDIAVDVLKGSIRTRVPLKAGQRQSSDRLDGVIVNALRIYGRALAPGRSIRSPGESASRRSSGPRRTSGPPPSSTRPSDGGSARSTRTRRRSKAGWRRSRPKRRPSRLGVRSPT